MHWFGVWKYYTIYVYATLPSAFCIYINIVLFLDPYVDYDTPGKFNYMCKEML